MHELLKNAEVVVIGAPVAAGSSIDNDSSIIDMQGFDGCLFVGTITDSVATGVASMIVEQNTANSGTGMAALAGLTATATSSINDDLNTTALIADVYRPRERYLRVNRTSATANIAFGDVIAVKYKNAKGPVTQGATVSNAVSAVSPAEA